MGKIRIIKKKKKPVKEKFIDFAKTSYGKKVLSALVIILVLIILLFALKTDPTGYYDFVGNEKRSEFLKEELKLFRTNRSKELQEVYKDGFCLFAVHKDSLIFNEMVGSPEKYSVEWAATKFNSKNNQLEIVLPIIDNLKDSTKISSRTINIKNNHNYSFNAISGTNLLLKAEIERYGDYGDFIIIGIQEKDN